MTAVDEIFVVSSTGSGHLFPCIQLCNRISSRNYKTTLVLPSNLLSSVPSHLSTAPISPGLPKQMSRDLEAHLSLHSTAHVVCAIVDFQMAWTKHVFWKFNIPVTSFFTFGACAAAMEWGAWKSHASKISPGQFLTIPGLPEEMCITFSDLNRRPVGGPKPRESPAAAAGGGGPPKPGERPPWVPLIEGSIGLMFNTCNDLELPFMNYIADQIGLHVWGVGPLLPELYWQPSGPSISDRQIRQSKQHSNYSEDEVTQWLDSKPRRSVLYVAFGSEVGPTMEEYPLLAGALEDSTHPFIWVMGLPSASGADGESEVYYPHGMDEKIGDRGLIIRGWAPQLMILSHPSTGGFLSHCGWNSTIEAIGRGVPFLAWPIRGDQFYNAKLVVNHLKIGYMVSTTRKDSLEPIIEREDILQGIEKLMVDVELHERSMSLHRKFESGFPRSSEVALDDFNVFMKAKTT